MDGKTIGHKLRALRGERIPRDQIKKRIAQYFGQSVEEIFFAE